MRIWLVNPFDNLPGEGCRAGRYELLARSFAAAGHEVVWWTSDFSHTRKTRRMAAAEFGYEIRLVPTLAYSRNVSWRRIRSHRRLAADWARLARQEREWPRLVIASSPPLALGVAALKFAREVGARFVVDLQDLWPETFYRLLPRFLAWAGPFVFARERRLERRLVAEADLVTGVCDGYREWALRLGARDYYRAYLGIAALPPERRTVAEPLRVAYVGNLGRGYDLKTVKAAVEAVDGATLWVAGDHPVGREGKVTYLGYLGERLLAERLKECDVGVVPMSAESMVGVPNKVADYAAAGLVVVSSLAGECAELLRRTRGGVTYRPGDVDSLVAALNAARQGSFDSRRLWEVLDAGRIYPDYVRAVTERLGLGECAKEEVV